MLPRNLEKLLSWVSPEDEDHFPQETLSITHPVQSGSRPTPPMLSRSKSIDPSSVQLSRSRALSRPQYVRSSTLRTIDEGESPHGSYLSRSGSFPPTVLASPVSKSTSSSRSHIGTFTQANERQQSFQSSLQEKSRSSEENPMSTGISPEQTPHRQSTIFRLEPNSRKDVNEQSPSPSPGRLERRYKASLGLGRDERFSTDESPTKGRAGRKSERTAMPDRKQQNGVSVRMKQSPAQDLIENELNLRESTTIKGKGKAYLTQIDAISDSDDDAAESSHRHLDGIQVFAVRSGAGAQYRSRARPLHMDSINDKASRTETLHSSATITRSASVAPTEETNLLNPPDLSTLENRPRRQQYDYESPDAILDADIEGDLSLSNHWYKGPLFEAGWKLALMFIVFTTVIVGVGWFALPAMDPADKASLKLPRSFQDLQMLNTLFQKYKRNFPVRILAVGCSAYLYVQMFSLPGSMYISILFGAAYGVLYGLILSCLCEAFGALLCYTLSAVVGPPLLTIPSYRQRLEAWRLKIMGDPDSGGTVGWDGVFAFLIVLRISPFPPHWVANVVAPHLDISPFLFWSACFVGIGPVSVIHVTIGSGLDKMTSAEDFHILSLRNVLGLIGIGVAVMIPTALKRIFKKDLSGLGEAEVALNQPHIHIQAIHSGASSDGERSVTNSLASNSSTYECEQEDGSPHTAGLSLISPRALSGEGFYWSASGRNRQRKEAYMDLDEALSIIQHEEDHEILAVAYPGDTADSVLGVYEREAAAADNQEEDYDQVGNHGPDYTSLVKRHGYGTLNTDLEHQGDPKQELPRGHWWRFWK